MKSHFNSDRMFTYVKGFAIIKYKLNVGDIKGKYKLLELIKRYNPESVDIVRRAYEYADLLHEGQMRQSGEPYIIHPLTMVCQAISLGIEDDIILSAILLHDVVEDTSMSDEGREAVLVDTSQVVYREATVASTCSSYLAYVWFLLHHVNSTEVVLHVQAHVVL